MTVYHLQRSIPHDGALVYLESHEMVRFKTGRTLRDEVTTDVELTLDEELRLGPLPTFFTSPTLIGTERLCEILATSCDNVELYGTVIRDPVTGHENRGYRLVNVIGRVACADMERSTHKQLGPGITMIDELVLDSGRIPDFDIFHLHEDTDYIIVSESIRSRILRGGFSDVVLHPLPTNG